MARRLAWADSLEATSRPLASKQPPEERQLLPAITALCHRLPGREKTFVAENHRQGPA
jgi:hypothetical protein